MTQTTVLTLILVGGVLAVLAATIADYRSHRRVEAAMRRAAGLDPEPAARPDYVSDEQLAAGAPQAIKTDDEFERELAEKLAQPSTTKLALRLADERFATHTGGRLIVQDAAVLVCIDQPRELRELLGLLRQAAADESGQPLVIAAPSYAENVLNTLAANRLADTIAVHALSGAEQDLRALADACQAHLVDVKMRQSGAVTQDLLGRIELLVADLEQSSIVAAEG